MIRHIDQKNMGRSFHGWLDSHFHFSFADYFNPDNINFGILRVINDDLVQPGTGFDMHPHKDMEILSYVIEGELAHTDNLGNEAVLGRGQVQYMSAGTGVVHSEYNLGEIPLRFLQIWIMPDQEGHQPQYGDYPFILKDRLDRWLPIASWDKTGRTAAPIRIHADANVYASIISAGSGLDFQVGKDRQAYLVVIEASVIVNGMKLQERDGLEVIGEDLHILTENREAHLLLIEMAKAERKPG